MAIRVDVNQYTWDPTTGKWEKAQVTDLDTTPPYSKKANTITLTGAAPQSDEIALSIAANGDIVMLRVIRVAAGATPYTSWDVKIWDRASPRTGNLGLVFSKTGVTGDVIHVPSRGIPLINADSPQTNNVYVEISATAGGASGSQDVFSVEVFMLARRVV